VQKEDSVNVVANIGNLLPPPILEMAEPLSSFGVSHARQLLRYFVIFGEGLPAHRKSHGGAKLRW
jgi:hypothetical protein